MIRKSLNIVIGVIAATTIIISVAVGITSRYQGNGALVVRIEGLEHRIDYLEQLYRTQGASLETYREETRADIGKVVDLLTEVRMQLAKDSSHHAR